jgi:hypothetical protein
VAGVRIDGAEIETELKSNHVTFYFLMDPYQWMDIFSIYWNVDTIVFHPSSLTCARKPTTVRRRGVVPAFPYFLALLCARFKALDKFP